MQWYELTLPAQDEDEDDFCEDEETTDYGTQVFDLEDLDEDGTLPQVVAKWLRDEGAGFKPSDSAGGPGTWYDTEPGMDMYTGATSRRSYHLGDGGFTEDEERAIFALLFPQCARAVVST